MIMTITQARQSMFIPCNECYTLITHDLTDESHEDGHDFIPRQIFEGDKYIQDNCDMFHYGIQAGWICFPCSERTFDEYINDSDNPIYQCDFINGEGAWDCEGCDKCKGIKCMSRNLQQIARQQKLALTNNQ